MPCTHVRVPRRMGLIWELKKRRRRRRGRKRLLKSESTLFQYWSLLFHVVQCRWISLECSRRGRATNTTAKKCTKKCDARVKLLFCQSKLIAFCRSRSLVSVERPSPRLNKMSHSESLSSVDYDDSERNFTLFLGLYQISSKTSTKKSNIMTQLRVRAKRLMMKML